MNFTKSIATLAICSLLFAACKETANQPQNETVSVTKKVAEKPETATLKIDGMTCAMGCARTIEKKLAAKEGVQEAKVDFDTKEATVQFDAAVLTPENLVETVEAVADGKTYKVSGVAVKG